MALEVSLAHQKLSESETALNTVDEIIYYYDLYRKTLSDEAYMQFVKHFNKYLEVMAPVKRVPGIANVIANSVVLSLWDVDVEPNRLRSLLINLLDLRFTGARFEEVKYQLKELMRELEAKQVVDDYVRTPDDALAFALTLLVVSTNPY